MRLFLLLLFGCSLFAQRVPARFAEYKPTFQQVVQDRWLDRASQSWAESGFNPLAVSPVGAKGLGQAMDGTWKGYQKQKWVPLDASPFDPQWAIVGQHRYMLQIEGQMRNWMGPVPKEAGWYDASLAGYNAGPGNIKKCFFYTDQLSLPTTEWKRMLPKVTKQHSVETLTYLPRNKKLRAILEASR